METENLFNLPPLPLSEESITVLYESETTRIERIVSTGQVSDWYDQEESEFVSLLQGEAELTWANGSTTRLAAGDTLIIPPHKLHKVTYTGSDIPCIWLCVFTKE